MEICDVSFLTALAVRHVQRGEIMGTRRASVLILSARGIAISDETREGIMGCVDGERLETWLRRALDANSINEVFTSDHVTCRCGAQLTSSVQVRQSSTTP